MRVTYTQDPLFSHGGFGEATRTTVDFCSGCWTVRVVSSEAVRPIKQPR